MRKVAIIGGGLAGLGAAYELSKNKECEVFVFEKAPKIGGLSGTVTVAGRELEAFYHHMFPNYFDIFDVSREIGIGEKLFFRRAKTGIYYGGKAFPFDTPGNLLAFSPLSFFDRIRAGFVIASLKLKQNLKKFDGVTAEVWLTKMFGARAYQILWKPLLSSKFSSFYRNVGMAWFWGRAYERPSRFGYFKGSFSIFFDALKNHLEKNKIKIFVQEEVFEIKKENSRFSVKTSNRTEIFDDVVVASAPVPFSKMTAELLPPDFIQSLEGFKYLGAMCAIVVLKRHLSDFYWLNINDGDFPFLGIIEQTHFVDPDSYAGLHPVYLSKYLESDSDFFQLSDEEIWSRYLPALQKINPEFSEEWVVEKYIFRAPFAQPVITPEYRHIIPSFTTPTPNLWWVSMSHIFPWDRGVDHAFHAGRELARELLKKNGMAQ